MSQRDPRIDPEVGDMIEGCGIELLVDFLGFGQVYCSCRRILDDSRRLHRFTLEVWRRDAAICDVIHAAD